MSRRLLTSLTCWLILSVVPLGVACGETDWIKSGSFVELPESFDGADFESDLFRDSELSADAESRSEETGIQRTSLVTLQNEMVTEEEGEAPLVLPVSGAELSRVASPAWQILPDGLLYHSYLAGEKEPRFASQWLWDKNRGMVWEAVVGGRWGLVRKGGEGPDAQGFQFDVIGAAFVRIDPEEEDDLEAADFNAGFVGTWHYGKWRYKVGYTHYSCHLGDEYIIKNPGVTRYNYVRDSLLAGVTYDITPNFQIYGEIADALNHNGGAQPLELQFGTQWAPRYETGFRGAPFAAVHGHLRQEFNVIGSVNFETGWAWFNPDSGRMFRVGFQHYNGPSMQWSLVGRYENMTGIGMWFDY
ncbi:DUF1207 domain-containing protein [Planctomicrobium piriforme]|uniref:DUF1207 domain-containing protein n=1 Tax=Planctomicrobium piriforme TaxID=1576369 RepID=A0A1I3FZ29_9PLAN|nr:DUF1207 domain-containing protein [Planctomicrobium piriforme]SFI16459.1 Protein of unknown function [Planctomicrobium piriforme]